MLHFSCNQAQPRPLSLVHLRRTDRNILRQALPFNQHLEDFMDSTTSKAHFLQDLKNEQANWEQLLNDIGEAHMTQPGVAGEWSIKDIVAHLTGWRKRTVARFQ